MLVAEGWNVKTGLGSRFGSELLKRGFKGKYNNIGTHRKAPAACGSRWAIRGWIRTGIQKAIKATRFLSLGSRG